MITRSGTIGRVAYITKRLNGAIVSDDLIRVRIPDEGIRNYALQFLQSDMALNQMLKNEYGAVQQHLEPNHVSDILIPIPANWADADQLIENVRTGALSSIHKGSGYGEDINTGKVLYHSFEYTTPLPTSSLLCALLGVSCKRE